MHRHPILYPIVASYDPPEIQVSHLRILPYREHGAETTVGPSKYVSFVITPSVIRGDPTGLGPFAVDRQDVQAQPNPLSQQHRLDGVLGPSPHAYLQLADNGVPCLRLSSRRPSSYRLSPTKQGAQQGSSFGQSGSAVRHSHLCDQRLEYIKIPNWTQVFILNDLGARLILFYLTVDHLILGLFDADLFLGDLVAYRTEFCCPLLLSAVLCFVCVC